jgi:MbtH protein
MTNPFEDPDGTYHVLINGEGQHSLWPSFVDVPAGWTIACKASSRSTCLDYVNANWTDIAAHQPDSQRGRRRWCP